MLLTGMIYLGYCAFISYMALKHHVFWRDEVRALSIAKEADGFSNLPELLENEGHPILWYVLFKKTLYIIFRANWVLPLASILVAMASALLWLCYAPFFYFCASVFSSRGLSDFRILCHGQKLMASACC